MILDAVITSNVTLYPGNIEKGKSHNPQILLDDDSMVLDKSKELVMCCGRPQMESLKYPSSIQ